MLISKKMIWDSRIGNKDEILDALKSERVLRGIFFVCISREGIMQIMSNRQLYKKANRPDQLTVIGAAKGRSGAFELLAEIYSDRLSKYGSIDGINEYYI